MPKVLSLFLAPVFFCISCMQPGGGGVTQVAPETVRVGEPATIRLDLSVWGAAGKADGRYTNIKVWHRRESQGAFQPVAATPVSGTDKVAIFEARIPGQPAGEIEYYIELELDGHLNRIAGLRKIRVI